MTLRDVLISFAQWRDRRLRFRAAWWRDRVVWLVRGGRFKRVREEQQKARTETAAASSRGGRGR